jgi:hypothetical protein
MSVLALALQEEHAGAPSRAIRFDRQHPPSLQPLSPRGREAMGYSGAQTCSSQTRAGPSSCGPIILSTRAW